MKLSRLAIALYVGLVFLSGVAVGGLGYRLYTAHAVSAKAQPPNPADLRRSYVHEMQTRIKLTDEQVKQVDIVLEDVGKQFDHLRTKMRTQVWDAMRPDRTRIHAEQIDRINAVLSPEQRAEYQKMRDERQRQHQQHEKEKKNGMTPPSPPPGK